MRRRAAVLLALAACSSEQVWVPVDVPAGGTTLTVLTDREEEPIALVVAREGTPATTLAPTTSPVFAYTFTLAPGDLIGDRGEPLDLNEVSIRLDTSAPAATGACGRCLAPFSRPPHPLLSGDRCLLPRFSAGAVRRIEGTSVEVLEPSDLLGEQIDRVRRRVLLERGGDCACARRDTSLEAPPFVVDQTPPPGGPPPVEVVAAAPDGTILIASTGAATALLPGGERLELRDPDLFRGHITAVAPEPSADRARFWIFSDAVAPMSRTPMLEGVEVAGGALRRFDARIGGVRAGTFEARAALLRRSGALLVFGNVEEGLQETEHPFAGDCTANGGELLDCATLDPPACPEGGGSITSALELEDGTLLTFSGNRAPLILDGSGWTCGPRLRATASDETYELLQVQTLGAIGTRAFACGVFASGSRETILVATASIAGTAAERAAAPWTAIRTGLSDCRGFAPVPGDSSQAYIGLRGDRVLIVDDAGRVVRAPVRASAVLTDLDQPLSGLGAYAQDELLVLTGGWDPPSTSIYRGPPLRRIYGPEAVRPGDIEVLLELDGELWAFDHLGIVSRVRFSGGEVTVTPLPQQPLAGRRNLARATVDRERRRALVVANSTSGQAREDLVWIDLDSGAAETIVTEPGIDYRGFGELAPGRFLVVTLTGAFLLHADTLVRVELDLDDPSTPEVEDDLLGSITAVSGANGVVWMGGDNDQLFRARGDPPVIDRFAARARFVSQHPEGEEDPFDGPRSLLALCPDHVLVAGASATAELVHDARAPLGLQFDYFQGFGVGAGLKALRSKYRILRWLDPSGRSLFAYAESGHIFLGQRWVKAPFSPSAGVSLPDGRLVIATSQHRYALSAEK